MIHRTRSARNRDLALTTLIDLLVQIIFVFTLILISADVMGSESREPGWERAEPKMVTPLICERVSNPSTNSPMMRKIRQESLAAKSSIGSRGSKLYSFNTFRPVHHR